MRNGSRALGAPVRRRQPKTSEIVAREIAQSIIDQELPPGAMLPTENHLREEYAIGRSTLREALLLLETRGVITVKSGPRGGPVVRRPRPADLSEALTLILQFEGASLQQVLDARRALEPTLARLAAQHATTDDVAQLQASVDALTERLETDDVFLEENERFHTLVAEIAGNAVLAAFSGTVKSIADGAVVGVRYSPARRRAVVEAHQRIVDAIAAGDERAAAKAMAGHIDEAGQYWQRKYRELVRTPVRWGH